MIKPYYHSDISDSDKEIDDCSEETDADIDSDYSNWVSKLILMYYVKHNFFF